MIDHGGVLKSVCGEVPMVMRGGWLVWSGLLLVFHVCGVAPVSADHVIFDTTPVNNQANLTASAGQTFTTPDAATLGAEAFLKEITQFGPTSTAGGFTYAMELYEDLDQDPATWGLGTLLASTGEQTIGINQSGVFDFTPFAVELNPDTVYALRYVNAFGQPINVLIGLRGGNDLLGAAQGSLFSNGATPFSNGFDSAMVITMYNAVPEPGAFGIIGLLGLIGTAVIRRR